VLILKLNLSIKLPNVDSDHIVNSIDYLMCKVIYVISNCFSEVVIVVVVVVLILTSINRYSFEVIVVFVVVVAVLIPATHNL